MSAVELILLLMLAFFGLPVLVFLLFKFGTAGYLSAKKRQNNTNQKERNE